MDPVQFERWKEFCRAMIFNVYTHLTDQRRAKLWAEIEEFIDWHKDDPIDGWDGEFHLNDLFDEWFYRYSGHIYVEGKTHGYLKEEPRYFFNQLRCITRAGIDVATGQLYGVLGFTVGDMKQLFGGEMPAWFCELYENLTEETPENMGLWL